MERPPMFMDWKNQYCKMIILQNSTILNLQIQCKSNQYTKEILQIQENTILNCIQKHKRLRIVKVTQSKKNTVGGITTPDFKLYYRAIIILKSMVLAQKQTNKSTLSLEQRPRCNYSFLIFDKQVKRVHWKRDNIFSKWCQTN